MKAGADEKPLNATQLHGQSRDFGNNGHNTCPCGLLCETCTRACVQCNVLPASPACPSRGRVCRGELQRVARFPCAPPGRRDSREVVLSQGKRQSAGGAAANKHDETIIGEKSGFEGENGSLLPSLPGLKMARLPAGVCVCVCSRWAHHTRVSRVSSGTGSSGAGIQADSEPRGPDGDRVLELLKLRLKQELWPGRLHLAGWIEAKEKLREGGDRHVHHLKTVNGK